MRFDYQQIFGFLDAQRNFEQIQTSFSFPTYADAPINPDLGMLYFDSTLNQCGYWNGTAWVYW